MLSGPLVPTKDSASARPLNAPAATAAATMMVASRFTFGLTRGGGGGCGSGGPGVVSRSERRWGEGRGADHEHERKQAQGELESVVRQRLAEHDRSRGDGAQVRGC